MSGSVRNDLLPMADDLRGLRGSAGSGFDVQTVKLAIVKRVWDGGRRGIGTMTQTTLRALLQQYPIRQVTAAEVASSGGRFEMEDLKMGPVTPILSLAINAASNASPIVIGTTTAHGFGTGQQVTVAGVLGNTNANGDWTATYVDPTHFSLDGSSGNAPYTGGGTVQIGYSPAQLKPNGQTGTEIVYVLTGSVAGDYQLRAVHTEKAFSYFLILRRMETTA